MPEPVPSLRPCSAVGRGRICTDWDEPAGWHRAAVPRQAYAAFLRAIAAGAAISTFGRTVVVFLPSALA